MMIWHEFALVAQFYCLPGSARALFLHSCGSNTGGMKCGTGTCTLFSAIGFELEVAWGQFRGNFNPISVLDISLRLPGFPFPG